MRVEKARYFLWALLNIFEHDFSCPSCRGIHTRLVHRKAWVTSLWECEECGLRFRVPKESLTQAAQYYQAQYAEGLTTDCPSDEELERLLATGFRSSQKDFSRYIEVLQAAGLRPGDSIFDFGCSWGYGSWQLREAGFEVYSYDVSIPRARYAATKLGCRVVADIGQAPKSVDCFLSVHVIEHLPDPNVMWKAADNVLSPGGMVVCFTPNGNPDREKICGSKQYHQLWGKKHPLLLTPRSLREMAKKYGFSAFLSSSPHATEKIELGEQEQNLTGVELALLATRNRASSI